MYPMHCTSQGLTREIEMIATLRKGWTVTIDGVPYQVLGSRQLRGTQRYIVQGPNGRKSLKREDFLAWQYADSKVSVQVSA